MSNPIFVLLLTRLQTSKTDKYCQGLIRFICFAAAIQKEGCGADKVIAMLDGCQPQPGFVLIPFFLRFVSLFPDRSISRQALGPSGNMSDS